MDKRIEDAVDFALTNGLLKYNSQFKLTHAPVCLTPFRIKKDVLTSLEESTPLFNELMMKVGADRDFLQEYLNPVAETDEFIRRLLKLYVDKETSHHLQISRNDFLLSHDENTGHSVPKQVEFNTISNSFIFLAQRMYLLHKHMEHQLEYDGRLVFNDTLDETVATIGDVVNYYGSPGGCMLMVVQKREQNLFDQRGIEYRLREKYGIETLRRTLEEIAEQGRLKEGHLFISNKPVALTYFRAGYTPNDYTSEAAWKGRYLVETSATVKCPTAGMQLAGAKKIQQVLTSPGILKRYLPTDKVQTLKEAFVGMYDLDESVQGTPARDLAARSPKDYILKPQREGGGNNLYDKEMVARIQKMTREERKAFVLMERIKTPSEKSLLVVDRMAEETLTVSEIGRYGACFYDGSTIRFNKDLGYLIRTKSSNQNEGGVCAGYACLNSLIEAA